MKRLLFIFLAVMTAGNCFSYDFEVDGIYYNILSEEDKTVEVTYEMKFTSSSNYSYNVEYYSDYSGDIVINNTVSFSDNYYSVISIGNNAFCCCSGLTSIIIPNSVTSIGDHAFEGCSGLTSITIPKSVTSIGEDSFRKCSELTSVTFHNGLNTIGYFSFWECDKVKEINLSFSDEEDFASYLSSKYSYPANIDVGCLSRKHNIIISGEIQKTITIPNSVSSICQNAFFMCKDIESITIHNSVTYIGENAFDGCNFKEVNISLKDEEDFSSYLKRKDIYSIFHANQLFGKKHNIIISGEKRDSISIPDSIDFVIDYAFFYCTGLKNIIFPTSIDAIGQYSFCVCDSLTNVIIPNSVTYIGRCAFYGCCNIKSINIPKNLKTISPYVFKGCSSLTGIIIPNSVTSIGSASFQNCSGLKSITIPNSVTSISKNAFDSCSELKSITIPNSVTFIGDGAFLNCIGLNEVTNYSTTPQTITSTTFPAHKTLHVLPGYKELYQTYEGWRDFVIKEDAVLPIEEVDAETYNISDGLSYNSSVRTTSNYLTYSRTFNNTKWQALYVPFSIPVSKLTESGLVIAELNDTHQRDYNSDGVADSTWIEFFTLQSGSTEANYPYLIKANEPKSVTINLENVTVEPAETISIECSTTRQRFTFTGTYEGVIGSEMYSKNYYALAGGSLKRAASSNASIKPQRWYMTIENKNGTTPAYFAPAMRFIVDGIEDETTSIESVLVQSGESNAYSITGSVHSEGLKPGIYVQNGKKIIVK